MQQLGFELLPHPTYSLDLVPSDYHIFDPLKETLPDRLFSSDGEAQQAAKSGLREKRENFDLEGTKKYHRARGQCRKVTYTFFLHKCK